MKLTAVLTRPDRGAYEALNPETGTRSQGATIQEAIANLREATIFYLETMPVNTAREVLVTTFEVSADEFNFEPLDRTSH